MLFGYKYAHIQWHMSSHSKDHTSQDLTTEILLLGSLGRASGRQAFCLGWDSGLWRCVGLNTVAALFVQRATDCTEVHGGLAGTDGVQGQGKMFLLASGDTVLFYSISFSSVANTAWVMDQTQPCSASCWHQNIEWWFIYWEHSRIIFYPMCIMWYLDIWVNPAPMRPFRE
jgi:hypothetical protein